MGAIGTTSAGMSSLSSISNIVQEGLRMGTKLIGGDEAALNKFAMHLNAQKTFTQNDQVRLQDVIKQAYPGRASDKVFMDTAQVYTLAKALELSYGGHVPSGNIASMGPFQKELLSPPIPIDLRSVGLALS